MNYQFIGVRVRGQFIGNLWRVVGIDCAMIFRGFSVSILCEKQILEHKIGTQSLKSGLM